MAGDIQHSQAPAVDQGQTADPIVALLTKLDQQIAQDDPLGTELNADVANTIADIVLRLPNASPPDAKLVLAMPAHFAKRAHEAAATGHHKVADRFAAMRDVFGDLLKGTSPGDAAPGLPPDDHSSGPPPVDSANGQDTSPPSPAPTLDQPPSDLAERASNSRPNPAPADAMVGSAQNSRWLEPTTPQRQGSASIAVLLARLDKEIAADPSASEHQDDVANTVAEILALLPNASPADAKLAMAMPVHFANRSRAAENAGRHDEAARFAVMGDVLGNLFNGTTLRDPPEQQTPEQPLPGAPSTTPSGSPSITPAPPPSDPASENAPSGDANAEDDAPTSPPAPAFTPSQPPAQLAEPGNDSHPGMAIEPNPAATMPPPPKTAELPLPLNPQMTRSAPTVTSEQRRAELRTALTEVPSAAAGNEAKPPPGRILTPPGPATRPRAAAKAAAAPGAPAQRVGIPPPTKPATPTANAVDPLCRAIALKFEIGEEPSDAERSYLRHGCHQHS